MTVIRQGGEGGEMAYRGREMKERKGEGKGGMNDRGLVGRWSRTWREKEGGGKQRRKRGGGRIAFVR